MRKFVTTALLVLFIVDAWGQSFGIRAGVGQFASQAEQIDGKTGNSVLIGVGFYPRSALRIDVGFRFNGVSESEVNLPIPDTVSFLDIKRITQRVGYSGVYAAPGVNIDLSQIGTGMELYIYGGGGLGFSTIVTKVEFVDSNTTPVYHVEYEKSRDLWKPFWLLGAGVKAQIFYFGIFGEATYYDGDEVSYGPLTVSGEEITPAGTISPRGFAAYLGICWN